MPTIRPHVPTLIRETPIEHPNMADEDKEKAEKVAAAKKRVRAWSHSGELPGAPKWRPEVAVGSGHKC